MTSACATCSSRASRRARRSDARLRPLDSATTTARGLAASPPPRASRWGPNDDYVTAADLETMVVVTVETPSAVKRIGEILNVPDLGFVFLGPLDLSVTFSHPAEPTHPDVDEALADVRDAALDRGVPVGGARLRNRCVAEKVDAGYRMANPGNTTSAIGATVEGWIDETRG